LSLPAFETAYAKINLALHVRERMADGYHRIETLFAFAEHGDRLKAGPGDQVNLMVEGPFALGLEGGEDNLVLRAARALARHFGVQKGAALRLEKNLPIAAGIGGGSADAAAALRLLVRRWRLDAPHETLRAIAGALGADVPACLASVTARGEGRGDRLSAVAGFSGTPLLLVNPGIGLATGEVFRRWDGVDHGPMPDDPAQGRNDLEPAAIALAPAIGLVLDTLRRCDGVALARMSGSGATCFALLESEAARDAANSRIGRDHPGWWRLASRIR
jgi:4-diphosphocytidyl-2-C-methyl-D-erythritol kinase